MNFIDTDRRRPIRRIGMTLLLLVLFLAGHRPGDRFVPSLEPVSAQSQTATLVNAASFASDANAGVTPDSIGALFGQFVTQNNQTFVAPENVRPLPTTLGGVRVTIAGKTCSLFFVAPLQINLVVPSDLPDGNASIVVTNSDNTTRTGTVKIVRSEPGIFTTKADGKGTAAAQVLTTQPNGQLVYNTVFNPDGSEKDVNVGTKQQPSYLVLFGTGISKTPAANPNDANGVAESVTVTIQGVPCQVLYAGPSPDFIALDQVNVTLPPEMAGFGTVQVKLKTTARDANTVTIKLGGELPPVRLTQLTEGQTVNGDLTADDQVQLGASGNTFFFDGYFFNTTAPNTTVAIDLRSSQFDAGVLLFRIENGGLVQIGQDDQSGGYGAESSANNNNALMLAVLPTAGQYAVFASSSDFQPNGVGAYTLKLTTNVMQTIGYGQTVNGQIATTDYKNSADTYLDLYWFSGATNDNLRMTMNSTAFDSYVIFHDNDGDPPAAFDDNSGGGFNSLLNYRLPLTGIYIIVATPFEANKTGAYSLNLTKLASFGPDGAAMTFPAFKAPGRELPSRANPYWLFQRETSRRVTIED